MTKTDLKTKWGKYCDTDKLVDDMVRVLTENHHRSSVHGVCTVLDEYFTQKEPLIRMFATSNHYIGDMRIAVKKDFERDMDKNAIYYFCDSFVHDVGAREKILCYQDENGKVITDYMRIGHKKVDFSEFKVEDLSKTKKGIASFDLYSGATKKSFDVLDEFHWYMRLFKGMYTTTLYEDYEEKSVKLKKGTKTSRVFNKVCAHYGIDKLPNYNSLFAKYSDLVNVSIRKLYFVISLNPLDYLTMSNGVSWTSCHRITSNRGSAGMAASGCMSYMLDNCSIITYVVENMDAPIHNIKKLYRQMFYYADDLFIQSRLYPQGNDGATNLYDKFRVIVEEEFDELLNVTETDSWTHEIGRVQEFSTNTGHHYPDAIYNAQCGIFYPTEKKDKLDGHKKISIGHASYCCYCGKPHDVRSRLSHETCHI